MIAEGSRNPHWTLEVGLKILRARRLGKLNLPLDLADAVQILLDANPITCPHHTLQTPDVFVKRIQQAGPAPEPGLAFGEAAAIAEETLEDEAGVRFRGQWCSR